MKFNLETNIYIFVYQLRVHVETTVISAILKPNKLCPNTFDEIIDNGIGPKHAGPGRLFHFVNYMFFLYLFWWHVIYNLFTNQCLYSLIRVEETSYQNSNI